MNNIRVKMAILLLGVFPCRNIISSVIASGTRQLARSAASAKNAARAMSATKSAEAESLQALYRLNNDPSVKNLEELIKKLPEKKSKELIESVDKVELLLKYKNDTLDEYDIWFLKKALLENKASIKFNHDVYQAQLLDVMNKLKQARESGESSLKVIFKDAQSKGFHNVWNILRDAGKMEDFKNRIGKLKKEGLSDKQIAEKAEEIIKAVEVKTAAIEALSHGWNAAVISSLALTPVAKFNSLRPDLDMTFQDDMYNSHMETIQAPDDQVIAASVQDQKIVDNTIDEALTQSTHVSPSGDLHQSHVLKKQPIDKNLADTALDVQRVQENNIASFSSSLFNGMSDYAASGVQMAQANPLTTAAVLSAGAVGAFYAGRYLFNNFFQKPELATDHDKIDDVLV